MGADVSDKPNVVNFRGGKVHTKVMLGDHHFPECKPGMGSVFDWELTDGEINCKTCCMYERRRQEHGDPRES